MRNVVAALNSSIQFNKNNFWIDPKNKNQYYVGVQYREQDMKSVETMLNIPVTGPRQRTPVPLSNLVTIERTNVPTEVTHFNIQPTIEVTMGVHGRDLGHVADDVTRALDEFGKPAEQLDLAPLRPRRPRAGSSPARRSSSAASTARCRRPSPSSGAGLALAAVLIYFVMVALDRSWVVPLTVMLTVPFALVGILAMLLATGTAINVQSVLGLIFIVGIKVSNTVLMTDYAQDLRREEGLSPTAAIRKAASIRVRPVTMTALAAFLRHGPGRAGPGAGQRGERAAGPRDPRRAAGGRAGDAVRAADALLADGPRQAGAAPLPRRTSEADADRRTDD